MFVEMQECRISWLLRNLAVYSKLRIPALKLALRLEGGQFYSLTARRIIERHFLISIGSYSYGSCFDAENFALGAKLGVKIGSYVSIGPGVRVFSRNHPVDRLSTHPFFYNEALGFVAQDTIEATALEIGHDAWVGAGVMVLRGCSRIGIGAVVGAGSIVTKDIPDFAIAVGNPARVIRARFPPELSEAILASRWWDRPVADCVRHLHEMSVSLNQFGISHPLLCQGVNAEPGLAGKS
jgi:acetyltransferase-like isoleucine patch superfamily enzyme